MRMLPFALVLLPACATTPSLNKANRSEVELAGGWNRITNDSGDDDTRGVGELTYGYMLNEWAEFGGMFAIARSKADQQE